MISGYLTNEEKNQITSLLQAHDYREAEENFLSWVYHVRYACTLYKDLIHQNILNELESIHFADGVDGDGTDDYRSIQYATNCIAQALIDKAKKGYFNAGQPVTLAISFALSRNIFAIRNEDALISFIKENLEKCDYQGKLAG